jgi:hypothetical protein
MGRFIRDFGFIASVLLSPAAIDCLHAAIDVRTPDAYFYLVAGATLSAGALMAICCAIRGHLVIREHLPTSPNML